MYFILIDKLIFILYFNYIPSTNIVNRIYKTVLILINISAVSHEILLFALKIVSDEVGYGKDGVSYPFCLFDFICQSASLSLSSKAAASSIVSLACVNFGTILVSFSLNVSIFC